MATSENVKNLQAKIEDQTAQIQQLTNLLKTSNAGTFANTLFMLPIVVYVVNNVF